MRYLNIIVMALIADLAFLSCTQQYTPKPKGYFRIDLPKPHYHEFVEKGCPFTFHVSNMTKFESVASTSQNDHSQCFTLSYPTLNANIYCTYLPVNKTDINKEIANSRDLVSHTSKNITAVKEQAYDNPDAHVYASLFMLDEGAASPFQFLVTDGSHHFFRAALYYNCPLNTDSLAPVTTYLKQDLVEMIQSFNWKK